MGTIARSSPPTLGAIEFGYTFLVLHTVTQATAAGARRPRCCKVGNRTPAGGSRHESDPGPCARQVATCTVSGVRVQQFPAITGTGHAAVSPPQRMPKGPASPSRTIPRIFGLLGSSPLNSFTRTETSADEGGVGGSYEKDRTNQRGQALAYFGISA